MVGILTGVGGLLASSYQGQLPSVPLPFLAPLLVTQQDVHQT